VDGAILCVECVAVSGSRHGEERIRGRSMHIGRGEMWALVAAAGYAANHLFLRIALAGYDLHNSVAATIQALPNILLCLVLGFRAGARSGPRVSPLRDWRLSATLIGSGLLLLVVATPLLFEAFRQGGVLITTPVSGTQVLWGALLAALLLGERLNRRMIMGMFISLAGIVLLALGQSRGVLVAPTWWLAVPYALGAALCWAISGVGLTYAMRHGVDRYQALLVMVLSGVVALNLHLTATGQLGLYSRTPASALLDTLVAGLFNTVGVAAIASALALTSVASATTLNSLQVALAPLLAWLWLREDLSVVMGMGIALILVGVVIVQRGKAPDGRH